MPPGSRGPYGKTPQVRRRIVEAALEVFSASGYHGTTMKDVAAKAGLTPKGLNHHFASKEDLLGAVLEMRDENDAARHLPLSTEPAARLEMILAVLKEDALTAPALIELHILLAAEATNPTHPTHQSYSARYELFREGLSDVFETARAKGDLRSDMEPRALASILIAAMDGLQLQWLYDRDAVDVEALVRSLLMEFAPKLLRQGTSPKQD
jgi:AcrR family transcriptional regulator